MIKKHPIYFFFFFFFFFNNHSQITGLQGKRENISSISTRLTDTQTLAGDFL